MASYFIADLHLSDARPDILEAFVQFTREQATHADTLYILGDLFEMWVGDDVQTRTSKTVAVELLRLAKMQIPVYFIRGNRDALLGQDYLRQCQAILLHDEVVIDLYGHKTLLLHGDALCTSDRNYQRFRRFIHNPLVQWFFLRLPKKIRLSIATRMRQRSRQTNQSKRSDIMDVVPTEVTQRFNSHQLEWMIHGHTHLPAIHQLGRDLRYRRFVVGDWYTQSSILILNEDGYQLLSDELESTLESGKKRFI